jgi:hypothetical protein
MLKEKSENYLVHVSTNFLVVLSYVFSISEGNRASRVVHPLSSMITCALATFPTHITNDNKEHFSNLEGKVGKTWKKRKKLENHNGSFVAINKPLQQSHKFSFKNFTSLNQVDSNALT